MSITPATIYNKDKKIWHGPKAKVPLYHPDCSVGRILFSQMQLKPTAIALQSDTENICVTYEQLLQGSIRIAMQLKNMGIKQDDMVGIVAGQTTFATYVLLGCWFNATAFHPVYPAHEQAVLEHLYSITRPKIIFCEGKYYQKVLTTSQSLQLNAKIYIMNDNIEGVANVKDLMQFTEGEQLYQPEELVNGEAQTVCILNSSGTSGLPKAVCISNSTVLYEFNFHENEISFCFSPLDWLTAIVFTVSTILAGARRLLSLRPFTPEYLVEMIEKYKITNLMLSPSAMACLVYMEGIEKHDLSSLRVVFGGGSLMPPTVFQKMRKLLKHTDRQILCNGYGSSEVGTILTVNSNVSKPGATGKLMPSIMIKIIDDNGRQLGVGEVGEIMLYNGKSWAGYYGNPAETFKARDEHLWFHSGDLAYFDEDGDLFIVDRKKDIMKYRGVHYSPHEIEKAIEELADVVEVCVFGNTNETEGDRAAAVIVKSSGSQLSEQQVIQHVAEKFEVEWKRLHGGVFFIKSLPKTGSGKIIRREVKSIALAMLEKDAVDH